MTDDMTPAAHAQSIGESRQRLIGFVLNCQEDDWRAGPLDGDPPPVGEVSESR